MVGFTGLIGTEWVIQLSIQVQRGLSVNLMHQSGGTMNIITDPTSFEKGGKFKQEERWFYENYFQL